MVCVTLTRRQSFLTLAAGALPAIAPARAEPVCADGLVVLTAGGLIEASNRGPFDPGRDRLFNTNNISFQKARSFSAGSLAALPQHSVTAYHFGREMAGKGPLLDDILAAAAPEAAAKTVRLSALDGYAAELALSDVKSRQWILAMETDGKPLSIGDLGPLFAMRQLAPGERETEEEEAKWVYSLYYIEVMP
ncbi:MAG: molybdopterin-dependent oxidoreductase [Rhodomicrobium sp.]